MGNTGSVIAQCVVSASLVVAGAAVAAASFGGASVIASMLISAGVSGATTAITNSAQGKPASWKDWGESTAIGAVTGLVGGALGASAGGLAKGLTEGVKMAAWKMLAVKGTCIVAGSMTSSAACNTITNVWNGRKPFEGMDVALGVGFAGGLFACAGAASFDSLKRSSPTSWLSHPVTRHSAGFAIDTTSSVVGGVVGAGLTGGDIEQAALIGLATGVAVGTVTTAVRCGTKNRIRRKQQIERENRAVVHGVREVDGVEFLFEQTANRDDPLGHRDLDHVDRHHRELKGRFDEPEHANVTESSRFYDLETANLVREEALPEAARLIHNRMAEKSPALGNSIVEQRANLANLRRHHANLRPPPNATQEQIDAARASTQRVQNAQRALSVLEQSANLVKMNRRLDRMQARRNAQPEQIAAARLRVENAHTSFDQVVGAYLGQVEVNVHMPGGSGYGYKKDSTRTREFDVRGATSYFKGAGRRDGSIAWREVTSFPSTVEPRAWADRVVRQRLLAGDRMNRRQVARNVLTQRHTVQRHTREEEEHWVGA